RLAADVVADAGGCHQIAFVRGVDEHATDKCGSVRVSALTGRGSRNGSDAITFQANPLLAIEPFIAVDGDCVLADQVFEYLLRDVRLKGPHGAAIAIHRGGTLALVAK